MERTFVYLISVLLFPVCMYGMFDPLIDSIVDQHTICNANTQSSENRLRLVVIPVELNLAASEKELGMYEEDFDDYVDVDCAKLKDRCKSACCPMIRVGGMFFALRYMYNGIATMIDKFNDKKS